MSNNYRIQDLTFDTSNNIEESSSEENIKNNIENSETQKNENSETQKNEKSESQKNEEFIAFFHQDDKNIEDATHLIEAKQKELNLLKHLFDKKVKQITEIEKENISLKLSISEKSKIKTNSNLHEDLYEKVTFLKTQNSILKERILKINLKENNEEGKTNDDEIKTSDNLTSEHDKLISSLEFNNEDPFKIFLKIIQVFEEIKDLLKKFSCNINRYYHKLNISQQENDDLVFYRSIILDSKKYYSSCHKIREKKLIYDLNKIMSMMETDDLSKVYEISKYTYNILRNSYKKLSKNVKSNNINSNNKPHWVKNDKLKYIETINREMNRCFIYHFEVNSHYLDNLISEMKFFNIDHSD